LGTGVLVGDSNAGQFSEGFVHGVNQAGLDATVATLSSCPFIDFGSVIETEVPEVLIASQSAECVDFVKSTLRDLESDPPQLVVISNSTDSWVRQPSDSLDTSQVVESFKARDAWSLALRETILKIEEGGSRVVVVKPVPKFPSWGDLGEGPYKYAPAFASLGWGMIESPEVSRTTVEQTRGAATDALDWAVEGTRASLVDFSPQLCPEDPCSARRGDTWVYRDVAHISIDAANQLAGEFRNLAEKSLNDSIHGRGDNSVQ